MASVAIIGAGRVGTNVAAEVVRLGVAQEVMLWNRSRDKLLGTVASLRSWAGIGHRGARISVVDWRTFGEASLVIVAVKEAYDPRALFGERELPEGIPRDLRYIGIRRDIAVLQDVRRRLAGYVGIVVVLTNPVDVVTSLFAQWLPGATVLGFGAMLDSARVAVELEARGVVGCGPEECLLVGEHGRHLWPLWSKWSARARKAAGREIRVAGLIENAKSTGYEIVRCLGYNTQDCGEQFARDIGWILGAGGGRRVFSVATGGGAIGRPVRRVARTGRILEDMVEDSRAKDEILGGLARILRYRRVLENTGVIEG